MNVIKKRSTGKHEATLAKAERMVSLVIGDSEFRIEAQPLSVKLVEVAKCELRETKENVIKGLAEIRELIRNEPDLYVPDDDYFFAKFLRPCKWYAKSAFELIKRFYRFQLDHPNLYENSLPSTNREIFSCGLFTLLPKRTKDGCRILLIETGRKWNPRVISLEQFFRGLIILMNISNLEPTTQVCGIQVIFDMDRFSLLQLSYLTPNFASTIVNWIQNCIPTRLKGIHIINEPFIWNMVYPIFKPFLKAKLRKRLHLHGNNRKSLLSYINPEALPIEYGGYLNFPDEPVKEELWRYLCLLEDECAEMNEYGISTF